MSGHWPPEWDDPAGEFPEGADQQNTAEPAPAGESRLSETGEARLSEVTAYLASVPAPVLPDAVEARISAALAAEAAARAERAASADGARKLEPSRARARVRRRHRDGGGPRRRFQVRPLMAAGSLGACLLFAGLGYAISQTSGSDYSSSSSGPAAGTSGRVSGAAGAGAVPSAEAPGPQYAGTGSSFVVTASGTKYQRSTLAEQVRTRLAVGATHSSSKTTVPAASASATSAVPSQGLRGCVLRLTKGMPPRLVDRASYEGEPAYVIASSSRVWVVGLGCTSAKTEVIASVPLAS